MIGPVRNPHLLRSSRFPLKGMNVPAKRGIMGGCERPFLAGRRKRGAPRRPPSERLSPSYVLQQSRILETATRRYLAAVRELARVRKLRP